MEISKDNIHSDFGIKICKTWVSALHCYNNVIISDCIMFIYILLFFLYFNNPRLILWTYLLVFLCGKEI